MPVVPSTQSPISLDVPGMSVQPETATYQAIARAGAEVAGVSTDMLSTVKQIEAENAVANQTQKDSIESEDYMAKLKLQSPDGYIKSKGGINVTNPDGTPRTITQEYRDWSNARFQDAQTNMPSMAAQHMYQMRAGSFFTGQMTSLHADEQVMRVNSAMADMANRVRAAGGALESAPDVQKLYSSSNELNKSTMDMVGKLYNKTTAIEHVAATNSELAKHTIEGAYNQVLYHVDQRDPGFDRQNAINQWRAVLAGTDMDSKSRAAHGLPSIADMLKPEDKSRLDRQFIRLSKVATTLDNSDLSQRVNEHEAARELGDASLNDIAFINGQLQKSMAAGQTTPIEFGQIQARFAVADSKADYMKGPTFDLANPDEQKSMLEEAGARAKTAAQSNIPPGANANDVGSVAQKSIQETLKQRLDSSLSEKQSDFADFMAKKDPVVKDARAKLDFSNPASFGSQTGVVRGMMKEQHAIFDHNFPGQPQYWRPLSKGDSETLAKTLMDSKYSTESTALAIRSLRSAYGNDFPGVMDQMIKDGGLHEGWRFAALQPSYLATEDVVGSLRGRSETMKQNFEAAAGSLMKEKDIDDAIAAHPDFRKFVVAQQQSLPNEKMGEEQVKMLMDSVKTKAMLSVISGRSSSAPDAVNVGVKSLITNNVTPVQSGGGLFGRSQKTFLNIPMEMGGQRMGSAEQAAVSNYAGDVSAEKLKKLGVVAPPQANGQSSQFTPEFYDQVARTGHFTVSRDQTGFNLWYLDAQSGRDVQAFTKDPRGRTVPLTVPVQRALIEGSVHKPGVLDKVKTFLPTSNNVGAGQGRAR